MRKENIRLLVPDINIIFDTVNRLIKRTYRTKREPEQPRIQKDVA